MPVSSDFTIDYTNKTIIHTSGASVYSFNTFYSWLMDLFDDPEQMDDPVPVEALAAQQFRLLKGWFIPNSSFEYLTGYNSGDTSKNGGSLTTSGWARVQDSNEGIVRVLRDTSQNIVIGDVGNAITHAAGDAGVLLDIEGDYLWIRPDSDAAANNFDSVSGNLTCNAHVDPQAAAAATGETEWSNLYSIGSTLVDTDNLVLYVVQNGAVVSNWATVYTDGHIDVLLRTKVLGVAIDSGLVTVFCREWGYTYDHFEVDLVNGGRLPAAISVGVDSNNQSVVGTVEAYAVAVTFGAYTVDVDQNAVDENYEIEVDLGSAHTVLEGYEYLKAITRRGETGAIDGVQGQLYTKADAAYSELKAAPLGSFAGGKFFGARGLHFDLLTRPSAEANKYQLIDSDANSGITEPTVISIGITSLGATDTVFVAKSSGTGSTTVDGAQYATAAAGNSTSSATVTLSTTPTSDTPDSGTVRLGPDGKRYEYSSIAAAVLTLDATAHPTGLDEDQNSANAYIPWLDDVSGGTSMNVGVSYDADKDVVIRVRKKGIKEFETVGIVGSSGLSVSAIRTVDGVVT